MRSPKGLLHRRAERGVMMTRDDLVGLAERRWVAVVLFLAGGRDRRDTARTFGLILDVGCVP